MRRSLIAVPSAMVLSVAVAGSVFAAHCVNESKPDGAGQHVVVLINPVTGAAAFEGTNANGRLRGGYADVYLDLDQSGTLTAADLLVINDTFLVANHSGKLNPGQADEEGLSVLPPILRGDDPGGAGNGVGPAGG
jgi:hypothetical protein